MNKYQDHWGRFHQKECVNGEPSGNNGWLFTAYAKKTGLTLDTDKLGECFDLCLEKGSDGLTHLIRSPGKSLPPISRDEILGIAAIFSTQADTEVALNWNFSPFPLPRFSFFKLLSQLWQAKGQHRNYFWQNNLNQLYRFAFSVPFSDRHFILKCWGKFQWYNPAHLFYAAVGKLNSLYKPNGLDWLKYGGERAKRVMVKEFPVDHPIRSKLGL